VRSRARRPREPSKNLLRGFLAFDELLDQHPEHRGAVTFVAEAYPSRVGVPAYAAYRADIEAAVTRINARWGDGDWQPIILSVEDDFPAAVAVMRRADVFLINPIRDGLNLVASEGALVSDRDAVLALSPEAGAWERLQEGALRVPPFDVAGTAAVLHRALTMAPAERQARAATLRAAAEARTPAHWLADLLAAAHP
jgi:trehalose 6-phosphate synthase